MQEYEFKDEKGEPNIADIDTLVSLAWERRIDASTELTNTKSGRMCQAGELEALKKIFDTLPARPRKAAPEANPAPTELPIALFTSSSFDAVPEVPSKKPVRAVPPMRPPLQQASATPPSTEKKCPFCAETIKAEAIVCRYCGRDLPGLAASPNVQASSPYAAPAPTSSLSNIDILRQPVSSASHASSATSAPTASSVPPRKTLDQSLATPGGCFGMFAIFCVLFWFVACQPPSKEQKAEQQRQAAQRQEDDRKAMASTMAESFVEKRLKSPGSAKFPYMDEQTIVNMGSGRWKVSGYVDSQNSFGALMRTNYQVIMTDQGENWTLDDISMQQQ